MFLEKYLNEFYFNQVLDTYDARYLLALDEKNFVQIYQLFQYYNFYFIEDIILKYLEIFTLDIKIVTKGLILLKNKLGDNFVYTIGNNMTYLNEILKLAQEDLEE